MVASIPFSLALIASTYDQDEIFFFLSYYTATLIYAIGILRIFFQIIAPLCKPVVMTVALITAISQWNDFYMPMVLLGKKTSNTLTLVIYQYIGQFTKYMSESMAAVVITLIPVIVLYFLFSSKIVEGLTGGAVKG